MRAVCNELADWLGKINFAVPRGGDLVKIQVVMPTDRAAAEAQLAWKRELFAGEFPWRGLPGQRTNQYRDIAFEFVGPTIAVTR